MTKRGNWPPTHLPTSFFTRSYWMTPVDELHDTVCHTDQRCSNAAQRCLLTKSCPSTNICSFHLIGQILNTLIFLPMKAWKNPPSKVAYFSFNFFWYTACLHRQKAHFRLKMITRPGFCHSLLTISLIWIKPTFENDFSIFVVTV